MQERNLFEYAIIRVMPKVEREEFLNIGVILYCAKQRFLGTKYVIDEHRLKILCADLEMDILAQNLESLSRICKGGNDAAPIGLLDQPSRFRWLTAARSTIIQTSKVHPGLCTDAQATLEQLFDEMVSL
ncbi:DUF3037 domain-containing protein [Pedobacter montanisoli]|uniref:DUF3037 domain-containing protein n=1 Tax=Pedobacter montanisoli TaxID=2923277 RepID=A0ABS9ZWB4_9SPHI|nr:DUF3037 domain-containing protein [Pedobacter montanisoli]MCJ0742582.1 DUF3037 domain-containing protein [Pedobacter montanisoli]